MSVAESAAAVGAAQWFPWAVQIEGWSHSQMKERREEGMRRDRPGSTGKTTPGLCTSKVAQTTGAGRTELVGGILGKSCSKKGQYNGLGRTDPHAGHRPDHMNGSPVPGGESLDG